MDESGSKSKSVERVVEAICQQWHARLRWWWWWWSLLVSNNLWSRCWLAGCDPGTNSSSSWLFFCLSSLCTMPRVVTVTDWQSQWPCHDISQFIHVHPLWQWPQLTMRPSPVIDWLDPAVNRPQIVPTNDNQSVGPWGKQHSLTTPPPPSPTPWQLDQIHVPRTGETREFGCEAHPTVNATVYYIFFQCSPHLLSAEEVWNLSL